MLIKIFITSKISGSAKLYHLPNKKGGFEIVPLYKAYVVFKNGHKYNFKVTRDTNFIGSYLVTKGKYVENGECPPNEKKFPYKGLVLENGKLSWRIQLYEEKIDDGTKSWIKGIGKGKRQYIQIHKGPGCSKGCFLIDGGLKKRDMLKDKIVKFIKQSNNLVKIFIYVKKRNK